MIFQNVYKEKGASEAKNESNVEEKNPESNEEGKPSLKMYGCPHLRFVAYLKRDNTDVLHILDLENDVISRDKFFRIQSVWRI